MGRVVVLGSVNADLVVSVARLPGPGQTVANGTLTRHGGGKGANQAVAAARLGARVALIGAVGDDDLGAAALAELRAEGVDVRHVARLGGAATGVAVIVVDVAGENQIAVASGANAGVDATLAAQGLATLAPAAGDVLVLGFELGDDAVLAGLRRARAGGAAVVLNPAPARALPGGELPPGTVLTPNAAEAAELTGQPEPRAAARALARRTGRAALVTSGAAGALLAAEGVELALDALAVDAVDTTGAGDALNGALAAELARGAPLREAARLAVAAASLSTRARGARTAMASRASVARALAEVAGAGRPRP